MNHEEMYRSILDNIEDGIYFVDQERTISFWNKAAEEITGYTAEEIIGLQCQNTQLNHIDMKGRPLCQIGCPLFATLADGVHRKEQVFVRHKDGYRIPVIVTVCPVERDGKIIGAVEMFSKNSETVFEDDLIDRLTTATMHDEMTQLPNRKYLDSFLQYKINEFSRFGRQFAILFADVDDFSFINNTYGHEAGDMILKNISRIFLENRRPSDLIGRWGGEEFLGIFPIDEKTDIFALGERFRKLIGSSVCQQYPEIRIHISAGITRMQKNDTARTAVRRADSLMYEAKRLGKNKVCSDEHPERSIHTA